MFPVTLSSFGFQGRKTIELSADGKGNEEEMGPKSTLNDSL
jgi:hypothetical protein